MFPRTPALIVLSLCHPVFQLEGKRYVFFILQTLVTEKKYPLVCQEFMSYFVRYNPWLSVLVFFCSSFFWKLSKLALLAFL